MYFCTCPKCCYNRIVWSPEIEVFRCPSCHHEWPNIQGTLQEGPSLNGSLPPNSNTWETIPEFPHKKPHSSPPIRELASSLKARFGFCTSVADWLVDQAMESLAHSPYDTGSDRSVTVEAVYIGVRMGFIQDPVFVEELHKRCVRHHNQSK